MQQFGSRRSLHGHIRKIDYRKVDDDIDRPIAQLILDLEERGLLKAG